jgi:hypothetical protein
MKHIPAPWSFCDDFRDKKRKTNDYWIRDMYGIGICEMTSTRVQSEANARLIASAPELLDALKALVACIDETRGMNAWNALEQANKAIAKAEGA